MGAQCLKIFGYTKTWDWDSYITVAFRIRDGIVWSDWGEDYIFHIDPKLNNNRRNTLPQVDEIPEDHQENSKDFVADLTKGIDEVNASLRKNNPDLFRDFPEDEGDDEQVFNLGDLKITETVTHPSGSKSDL